MTARLCLEWKGYLMKTDWKRSMAVLLGTGVIALTAACGSEVSGTAQGGIPAGAGVGSAQQGTTTGESSDEVTISSSEQEPAPATSVADPTTSPDPTSDGGQTGGASSAPNTVTPKPATPQQSETTSPGDDSSAPAPTTSSSGSASAEEYAFLKDYCLLMPKSYTTGLQKDATRKPDLSCAYLTPDSSRTYRAVTVGGGFAFSDDDVNQSYNVDAVKVKIDGREGYAWTNSSKSLYSAAFNLPGPDGREISILVIVSDDTSPAEMKKKALALAAEVSKEVPR